MGYLLARSGVVVEASSLRRVVSILNFRTFELLCRERRLMVVSG